MTVEYGEAVAKSLETMNQILADQKKPKDLAEGKHVQFFAPVKSGMCQKWHVTGDTLMEELSKVFFNLFERLCQNKKVVIVVDGEFFFIFLRIFFIFNYFLLQNFLKN